MPLLIKPAYVNNGGTQQVMYPADSVNKFQRAEYIDTFAPQQAKWGLYSFMKLTKRFTYNLNTIHGSPLVVQPLNSCEFTPGNTLRNIKQDFKPDRVKINERMCWDELFGSCFEHLLSYMGGSIELDAQGEEYINMMLQELLYQYTVGTRAVLATAGLYDLDAANFDFGTTPADQIAALKQTYSSTTGWVTGFQTTAADGSAPHLNVQGVITPGDIGAGNHAGGFVAGVYDVLKAAAPAKLLSLINKGGAPTTAGRIIRALCVVSPAVYNWVVNSYNEQNETAALNNGGRLKAVPDANGYITYFVDNVPIICADEIGEFDQFMAGQTYFASIIAAGTIQLGNSFDVINSINVDGTPTEMAIIVERSNQIKDGLGSIYAASYSLLKAVLYDDQLAVATIVRN